jgi:hypothetical protein
MTRSVERTQGEPLAATAAMVAVEVLALEREREDLVRRVEELESREHEMTRRVYRRGYFAGHAAGKRGAVRESAPERHARGELRGMLAGRSQGGVV